MGEHLTGRSGMIKIQGLAFDPSKSVKVGSFHEPSRTYAAAHLLRPAAGLLIESRFLAAHTVTAQGDAHPGHHEDTLSVVAAPPVPQQEAAPAAATVELAPPVSPPAQTAPQPVHSPATQAVPEPVTHVVSERAAQPNQELPPEVVQTAANPEPTDNAAMGSKSFAAASRDLVAIMTLPSGQAQPQERLFAGDALVGLLPYLEPAELESLTRTVSRLELVSDRLRSFLVSHADSDVSSRMLKDSQFLTDIDLLRLIPRANEQQLRLIARRRLLSMTVCDALISTRSFPAILDLLRNSDSRLSPTAFGMLPDIIKGRDDLLSALCNRTDVPQAVGLKLFWQANSNLRRYLLSRFLTESASLGRVMDVGIAAGAIPPLGGQAKPADVEQFVAQVESGNPKAARTLARCCRVAPETAQLIIGDAGGEPMAIVFKAMAQSRLAMAQALTRWVSSPACPISGENRVVELHALFDSMSYNKARMLLSYWDWASREAGPYTGFPD